MRPQVVAVTGAGSSDPIMVDRLQTPTNIGLAVVMTGSVTDADVEHTFDDVNDTSITPTWFEHPTLNALSANADGNLAFPPRFVRITIVTGTGTATLTMIQAGY